MTPKMRKVLDFIDSYSTEKGYSPTYREMMADLKIASVSEIHRLVDFLEIDGHLVRTPGRARGIELTHSEHRIEQASFKQFLKERGLTEDYNNFLKAIREMAA